MVPTSARQARRYYTRSATDLLINELVISPLWMTIRVPMPSPWIVVHGPVAERTPQLYELDYRGQDSSMADQERLRQQILAELPAINDFQRLDQDELDLTLPERLAAPVQYGCCEGSVGWARGLRNGKPGFIGYADSCLTNMVDANDAFSEELLTNPNGGAVGYVGNTRFSWIGSATTSSGRSSTGSQPPVTSGCSTTAESGLRDHRLLARLRPLGGVHAEPARRSRAEGLSLGSARPVADSGGRPTRCAAGRRDRASAASVRAVPDPPQVRGIRVHVAAGDQVFDAAAGDEGEVQIPAELAAYRSLEVSASHPDFVTAYELLEVTGPEELGPEDPCRFCCCSRRSDG